MHLFRSHLTLKHLSFFYGIFIPLHLLFVQTGISLFTILQVVLNIHNLIKYCINQTDELSKFRMSSFLPLQPVLPAQ